MDIGKNVQNLRKKSNMTQQDLADSLGISRSAVCRIENKPSLDTELLEKISLAFKVPLLNLLYDHEEDASNDLAADIIPFPTSVRDLHKNSTETYRKLPDKTRSFIRAIGIEIYNEISTSECKAVERFSKALQLSIGCIFDDGNEHIKKTCINFIDTYTSNWLSEIFEERSY